MSDEQNSFTVKDRRHFTPAGVSREDSDPAPAATAGETAAPREESPSASGEHPHGMPPLDFAGLLVSLGSQAGALLSQPAPKPEDLEGARGLIALLEILQQKSVGNRTPDEDQLIEGMLYQLRMAYVAVSRRGSAPV